MQDLPKTEFGHPTSIIRLVEQSRADNLWNLGLNAFRNRANTAVMDSQSRTAQNIFKINVLPDQDSRITGISSSFDMRA